jgi:hypothetical protein
MVPTWSKSPMECCRCSFGFLKWARREVPCWEARWTAGKAAAEWSSLSRTEEVQQPKTAYQATGFWRFYLKTTVLLSIYDGTRGSALCACTAVVQVGAKSQAKTLCELNCSLCEARLAAAGWVAWAREMLRQIGQPQAKDWPRPIRYG